MADRALIVTNQHYRDGFAELPGATADAEALERVLKEVGGFTTEVLRDADAATCRAAVQRFYKQAARDDLLLLHVSGHGRKDRRNRLHFVTSDTDPALLEATAVSAEFVADQMEDSPCNRIVALFDCCYSGAFAKGMRTRGETPSIDIAAQFVGRAQHVITSSTALQYSHESEYRSREAHRPSVFTAAVVEGLRGAADHDGDGLISTDDLFRYVEQRVRAQLPDQTPRRFVLSGGAPLLLVTRRTVHLAARPEDRAWSDWATALLHAAGYRVAPPPADPTGRPVLALVSAAGPPTVADGTDRLVLVRIADTPHPHTVDLVGRDEPTAATALLHALGRTGEAPERPPGAPRFPGGRPRYWDVPQRNRSFTGRSGTLENLRAQLADGTTVVLPPPQALYGLGGVGKTQLALEYAHRYMSHYELVWWIDAEQGENVVVSLADLARGFGLRVGDTVEEATQAALAVRERLERGEPTPHWLLIFDNADDPEAVRRFLPDGPGHVLVTSRNQGWNGAAEVLNVDVFDRAESVDHLTRRVAGLARPEAERVAEAVGDLPLAVEVAAAWLDSTGIPVDTYIRKLESGAIRALEGIRSAPDRPAGTWRALDATWQVSIDRLREQSPVALWLLRLCATFGPEPIPVQHFLHSREVYSVLGQYGEEPPHQARVEALLGLLTRYALVRFDAAADTVQMHRLVRAVVLDGMTDEELSGTMHQVHRVLAAARPARGDTDDPANWPALARIWPHLGPSRAQDCDEHEVRELLIDRVRYLWKRVDLDRALRLGRQLEASWTLRAEYEDDPDDLFQWHRQILTLRQQLANVLRSQGHYGEALALNRDVLAGQRELLGADHPHALMTATSMASDLRHLNRFREALAIDRDTHARLVELFGPYDPRSLTAANNLAIGHRMTGDPATARDLDRSTAERRATVLGRRHPYTISSSCNLARDLRELGDHAGAVALLREIGTVFAELADADLPEELRWANSLAVSLRRTGRGAEAAELAGRTYRRYRQLLGTDHLDVLACLLGLAADFAAAGRHQAALDVAEDAHQGYRRLLDEGHTHVLVCRNNLGLHHRACGDHAEAVRCGREAADGLAEVLGADHPVTLAATLNLANSLAAEGGSAEAIGLARTAHRGLDARYGPAHLDTVAAAAGLAAALGPGPEATALRAAARTALDAYGPDHPYRRALDERRCVDLDLEPQPM
ncbi:FxSxx-COOH system tetratricopeptide repeat protein [Kitasatospora sp. NPDC057198]|uniref:FxSxx-COOH system tetratricopeptide repeat protein n=1 Tax=Kitasatospora sp. NPDC057198 TaxID=3346046 RepID=UPI00363D709E